MKTRHVGAKKLEEIKRGVVYAPGHKGGEARIGEAVKTLKVWSKLFKWGGGALIAASVLGIVLIYLPLMFAEVKYSLRQSVLGRGVEQLKKPALLIVESNPGPTKAPELAKPEWKVPADDYSIHIPKISATSKVIGDVDAANANEYLRALKTGVAEAAGLAHPGQTGTTYLFAHSVGTRVDFARYNAVFYLLHKLEVGDKVEVVYQKKLYKYEIESKEILEADDVRYLVPQQETEQLVLQTCYPPGTTWKRMVVKAKRAGQANY